MVTRAQLLAAGVSTRDIERRLTKGTLLREYRGVYRVGHRAPRVEARYLAAVYACGEGALLSGRAAGHILELLKGSRPGPEVTTPTQRRIDGIPSRRSRRIDRREATTFRRIPVTTVPRTLVDLAAVLPGNELARACHEAGARARPRSAQTNRAAGGRRVDCRWPEHRLTVELDGYRYHWSRHAWERDRRREREARARSDEFRRYTYGDVFEHPRLMLRELDALLPRRKRG